MDRLIKVVLAAFLTLFPLNVLALDYDVEWPPSNDPKNFVLLVTIEKCETTFKVPINKLDQFANNDDAMKQLVDLAMQRYKNGCK